MLHADPSTRLDDGTRGRGTRRRAIQPGENADIDPHLLAFGDADIGAVMPDLHKRWRAFRSVQNAKVLLQRVPDSFIIGIGADAGDVRQRLIRPLPVLRLQQERLPFEGIQGGAARRAEAAGAGVEAPLERPAKRGRRLVTGGQGDVRHRLAAEDQAAGRPLHADAAHIIAHGFMQIGGKDAMKIIGRKAGHRSQRLDGQGRVQVLLDMQKHCIEPFSMMEDRLLTRLQRLFGRHASSIAKTGGANYPILALSPTYPFA